MSQCKRCRATIVWAVTNYGSRIPLDPRPSPAGTYEVSFAATPPIASRYDPQYAVHSPTRLYACHLDTCRALAPQRSTETIDRAPASPYRRGRR